MEECGIGKNLYVAGKGVFENTTPSTTPTTGAVQIAGGVGILADVNIGGSVAIGTDLSIVGNVSVSSGTVSFANATTSSSPTSGSVTLAGGVGIAGNMFLGGIANLTSTTVSTSPTTGTLIVTGGTGIGGDIYLAGVERIVNTSESSSFTTGSFVTAGGAGIAKNLNVHGNTQVDGALIVGGNINSTGGTVHFTNSIDSAAPNGGSVVLDGGMGIAKALFVGSPNNSTSPGSGGLVVSGGFGVALDAFIGGNVTLTGGNPLLTFNNSNLAAPAFNSHSVGTRILLGNSSGIASADYAVGLDTNVLWTSVPTNSGTESFRWYGGATIAMSLDSAGNLQLNGTTEATSATLGGSATLKGGVGIAKSVFIGANLSVTGTSAFAGAITTQNNITTAGVVRITNVTDSTTPANGSISTAGGLGVALSTNIGQQLAVTGNTTLIGTLQVDGTTVFQNSLESTAVGTGSVVISGGMGVAKNVNVGGTMVIAGSTTIIGDLFVRGNRTEVNTTTVTTTDNVVLVNSGPNASASAGLASKRYQVANDVLAGDVVTDVVSEHTGTAQSGTATTIVLDTGANPADGWYNGAWLSITAGTGAGQVRRIRTYAGSTRTATIYSTSDQAAADPVPNPVEGMDFTTVPASDSVFSVYSSQYVVTVFDEVEREYTLGTTAVNPVNDPLITVRNRLHVHAGSLKLSENLKVDTISNYTDNTGTTVEQVLIKQGDLSNVGHINGSLPDVTAYIELVDNDAAARQPLAGSRTAGSFFVLVADVNNTGSSASFLLSGSTQYGGYVNRATSVPGGNGESLTVVWNGGQVPQLKFLNAPNNPTGSIYRYKVKVIAV